MDNKNNFDNCDNKYSIFGREINKDMVELTIQDFERLKKRVERLERVTIDLWDMIDDLKKTIDEIRDNMDQHIMNTFAHREPIELPKWFIKKIIKKDGGKENEL